MSGMNRFTGKALDGVEHIRQSVADILTTHTDWRVMLRQYGSDLGDLVDMPTNKLFHVELYAAVAGAIATWEPRFSIDSVTLDKRNDQGRVILTLTGTVISTGAAFRLEGITV